MPKIFISYRRADSAGWVTAIYNELVKHHDRRYIFRDIDTIDYGIDFVEAINAAVQECDVLLAIIGPQWSSITDEQGRRRLDNPNDFVRLEITAALSRDMRLIPVLVGGTGMPYENDLPEELRPLCRRNALEVVDRDFEHHMGRLLRVLERVETSPPGSLPMPGEAKSGTRPKARVRRVEDILPPPFEWCEIPAGRVVIEKHGPFDVAAFKMAKYPITNAQFQVFVDADNGYANPQWWNYSPEAQAWRKENDAPQEMEPDDLPRPRVTWYEAVAFCRWLSARAGEKIMLPTGVQWQRAAQGNDGRAYPWGNKPPNGQLCNFGNPAGQTTPVTRYPAGASPYGVMDMSGNVWEWCLNVCGDPPSFDVSGAARRCARGGSCYNYYPDDLRVTTRRAKNPNDRFSDHGFRVVCVK